MIKQGFHFITRVTGQVFIALTLTETWAGPQWMLVRPSCLAVDRALVVTGTILILGLCLPS